MIYSEAPDTAVAARETYIGTYQPMHNFYQMLWGEDPETIDEVRANTLHACMFTWTCTQSSVAGTLRRGIV